MPRRPVHLALLVALLLTSATSFAGAAFAQSQATSSDSRQKDAAPAQGQPGPSGLQDELQTLRSEHAAVRALLRRMEEQQKALLEQVDQLQRRLDGVTSAVVQTAGPSPVTDASAPMAAATPQA